MNYRIASLAVLLMATANVLAQPPGRPAPPNATERVEQLAVLLDLNDGQKAAMTQVLEEEQAKMQAQRQQLQQSDQRPTREQMLAQRQQAQQQTLERLRPILTEQQLKKFEVLQAQRPAGPPGKGRDR